MYFGPAFQKLNSIGANWVVISPTWSYTAKGSAIAAITPGQDMLWSDLTNAVAQARNQGLSVAIAPTFRYASSETDYWQSSAKDANWWQDWFDNYRTFSIHYADLAAQTGASTLILGSGSLAPAMPGGTLADGSSSGVPEDAAARWENILTQVRSHFSGTIYWAMDYPGGVNDPPAILDAVDGVYLQWSSSLTSAKTYTENDLETAFSTALDQDVQPFQEQIGKPIVLAVMYPSATGAAHGCISQPSGECLAFEGLSRAYPDTPSVSLNLQEQVDIYNALFAAVNTRTYISGIVAKGFYPPAVLEDKSASLYGKPAMDVLWYWFPKMIQKAQ
jgi:hypothetical protein